MLAPQQVAERLGLAVRAEVDEQKSALELEVKYPRGRVLETTVTEAQVLQVLEYH